MEIKSNITLRDYQMDLVNDIITGPPGMTYVLCSKRQVSGKSMTAEMILLYYAINKPGSYNMIISPTYRQCFKIFNELKNAIEKTIIYKRSNSSTMIIDFANGSQIVFASAEQSIAALQGFTVSGILIFDEAAYIPEPVFYALFPLVDVYQAPILLASTPRLRDGLFYEYYIEGEKESNPLVKSYNWKDKAHLSPEKLAFYKKNLPPDTFKNYYLGEFASIGASIFGDISLHLGTPSKFDTYRYAGIDCSSGNGGDDTVVSIFNSHGEQCYIEAWNDKESLDSIRHMADLLQKWNVKRCQIELNSMGQTYYDILAREIEKREMDDLQLVGFNTTHDSKTKIVQQFQVALQNNEVQLLDNEDMLKQFTHFISVRTPSGKITYQGEKGIKDDMVMATLIAYDCTKVPSYVII